MQANNQNQTNHYIYFCECGSEIQDKKNYIEKHQKTKKHLSYVKEQDLHNLTDNEKRKAIKKYNRLIKDCEGEIDYYNDLITRSIENEQTDIQYSSERFLNKAVTHLKKYEISKKKIVDVYMW